MDAQTEAAIKRGLREAMAGRTTFIVAHRMSTISLADEVVVMDGGRIVDRGTHDELIERCPLYAEIAEHGHGGLGLPAAGPRAARGDGEAVSAERRRARNEPATRGAGRDGRPSDPITELDPETQGSDVAEETEDQANQPGRLIGTLLLARSCGG